MSLKLYYDLLSQPSRAVYIFLKLNNIPFEAKPVALRKGEHFGEEFGKITPIKLVPVIDDNGFILTESVAILKYLAIKYNVADHWYPRSDLQKQIRVDEYLNWQHFNTRLNAAMVFRHLLILPKMTKKPAQMDEVGVFRNKVKSTLDLLVKYYLNSKPFLCGEDISIADLLGYSELIQLYAVHEEYLYEENPVVKAWMKRVKEKIEPVYNESHKMILRVRETTTQPSKL